MRKPLFMIIFFIMLLTFASCAHENGEGPAS